MKKIYKGKGYEFTISDISQEEIEEIVKKEEVIKIETLEDLDNIEKILEEKFKNAMENKK